MSAVRKGIRAGAALAIRASPAGPAMPWSAPGARRSPLKGTSWASEWVARVLVVEPDDSARSILQVALTRDGFDVTAVRTAEEAKRALALGRPLPNVVVVEAELRGADGFSFCEQLRTEPRTAAVPVIVLSRKEEHFHPGLASGVGADDYLPKPIFVKDVVALVRLKCAPRSADGGAMLSAATLPLPMMLRALLAGTRSGRIELGGRGRISFRQGKVIAASFESSRDAEALMRALLLAAGEYTVYLGPALGRPSFSFGLRELVTGAFPRIARWQQLASRSVPLDALLVVDFPALAAALASLPDAVNALVRLFDGRRTVRDVLCESGLDEVTALEVVTRLYTMGVVVPAEPEEELVFPRPSPALFEPAPKEAEERLRELFGDSVPPHVSQPSPVPASDWYDELPFEGEGPRSLPPELERQLEAFRIGEVFEPPEPKRSDLRDFALGLWEPEQGASIEKVFTRAPILLTRPFAPNEHLEHLEEQFFHEGLAVEASLPLPEVASPPSTWRKVGVGLSALVLVGGAGLLTWKLKQTPPVVMAEPLEIIAEVEPAAPSSALAEGVALYEAGNFSAAVKLLTRAVEAEPARAHAWLMLGLARFDAGDPKGA
ncbi:MAG: response regulator, partial [Myxococcota bacterium]